MPETPGRLEPSVFLGGFLSPFYFILPWEVEIRTLAQRYVLKQRTGMCHTVASIPSGGQAIVHPGETLLVGRADQL